MNGKLVHRDVDAAADEGVRNSQPEGIGRVVVLDGLVGWNNLGRNVVFADRQLRPRAIFVVTRFPDEDELSQYDLDVHAILDMPELDLIVVLNHLGGLRGFRRSDILGTTRGGVIPSTSWWWFLADVERTVAVGGRLVGSVPRSDGAGGVVVSSPLGAIPDGERIPVLVGATAFGEVTALGVVPARPEPLIAVGGQNTVALVPLTGDRLGGARWEAGVGFRVATIAFHHGLLWAAGPGCTEGVDDYDWEQLSGGGFAALDPIDGATVMSGALPSDVAWGTGGVAVAPFGELLAAAGRTGRLHLVDPRTEAGCRSTPPLADGSLGIAHLAAGAGEVFCGFNRGGYHLHAFTTRASTPKARTV